MGGGGGGCGVLFMTLLSASRGKKTFLFGNVPDSPRTVQHGEILPRLFIELFPPFHSSQTTCEKVAPNRFIMKSIISFVLRVLLTRTRAVNLRLIW